jgi:hypothetical protein
MSDLVGVRPALTPWFMVSFLFCAHFYREMFLIYFLRIFEHFNATVRGGSILTNPSEGDSCEACYILHSPAEDIFNSSLLLHWPCHLQFFTFLYNSCVWDYAWMPLKQEIFPISYTLKLWILTFWAVANTSTQKVRAQNLFITYSLLVTLRYFQPRAWSFLYCSNGFGYGYEAVGIRVNKCTFCFRLYIRREGSRREPQDYLPTEERMYSGEDNSIVYSQRWKNTRGSIGNSLICLSVHLCIHLSAHPSVYPSGHPYIRPSFCLSPPLKSVMLHVERQCTFYSNYFQKIWIWSSQ